MASAPEIRERLRVIFTAAQAEVLAHVVGEARNDLVTRTDLHELTEVVKQIAEVQKDLAESHKELAEVQKKTELRMEQFAKTQEELFEAQSELFETQKELTWAMKDTRKQLGGLAQSVGYGLEAYAMERIPRILAKQMAFSEETSGPEQFVSPAGEADDVDVVVRGTLDGRPVVFLCETKTNISP